MSIERPLLHPSPMPKELVVLGIEEPYAVYQANLTVNGEESTDVVVTFHSADPSDIEMLSPVYRVLRPYLGALRDAMAAHHVGAAVLPVELAPGPAIPVPSFRGAPHHEQVILTSIQREPSNTFLAQFSMDGAAGTMRARFYEEDENFEVLECDPRLDDEASQLVEWYIERYRVGHRLEFPCELQERVLLFEEGTEIRSVVLESVERLPGARVLRYEFAGRATCYAQTWQEDATYTLALGRRVGGTKYPYTFMRLIDRHRAGEKLKFPLILRARNWDDVEVLDPEDRAT
jgi:hypothetical protein